MKYLILIVCSVLAFVSIRIQTNEVAKALYVEGCLDSSIMLAKIGKSQESEAVKSFCEKRKLSLDSWMKPM